MSQPRRSARIAARTAAKSKMEVRPSTMEMNMADYTSFVGELRRAAIIVEGKSNMMDVAEALHNLMNFLLLHDTFLDSLDDTAIQQLHAWRVAYHTAHDKWNQEFAENMKEAVLFNKGFFIDMKADAHNPGEVMKVLRLEAEKHNRITSAYIDIEIVYERIHHRL